VTDATIGNANERRSLGFIVGTSNMSGVGVGKGAFYFQGRFSSGGNTFPRPGSKYLKWFPNLRWVASQFAHEDVALWPSRLNEGVVSRSDALPLDRQARHKQPNAAI